MAVDSYTPITTSTRLQAPRNHRLYTTQRTVPTEYPLPEIGAKIEGWVGTATSLKDNIIFDVSEKPNGSQKVVTIQHTNLPSIAWTSTTYLSKPKGHPVRSTVIIIPDDPQNYPIPAEGTLISAYSYLSALTDYQSNIITGVGQREAYGGIYLTLQHMACPVGQFVEYESEGHIFPAIYPNATTFFPGGSNERPRVVPARIVYEYATSPASWLNSPTIWNFNPNTTPMDGPFEVRSVIARAATTNFTEDDGDSGRVGDFLEMNFVSQNTINDSITIYAPGSLFYTIDASIPSATQYAAWVANKTELMISRTIHPFYDWFYMRRTVWVRAQ